MPLTIYAARELDRGRWGGGSSGAHDQGGTKTVARGGGYFIKLNICTYVHHTVNINAYFGS